MGRLILLLRRFYELSWERKVGISGTAGQRRCDVGEVGYRGSTPIREASAVRSIQLSGYSRLNDYNRVG